MNAYALMLHACGLSHTEAATYHNIRLDTVRSWASGKKPAPESVVDELRDLHNEIRFQADQLLKAFAHYGFGEAAVLPYPETDEEAQAMRMPCVGAWRAMAAMFTSGFAGGPVRLYPYSAE